MAPELLLALVSFCTSLVAAVLGLGGGMLLIAILPQFLLANAVVPIHSVTQISSNASRAFFAKESICWQLLIPFIVGSLIGTVLFGLVVAYLPIDFIPLFIGTYILLNIWSDSFKQFIAKFESLYIVGFLQTGLGMLVGATGPFTLSILTKTLADKEQVIATSAVFM